MNSVEIYDDFLSQEELNKIRHKFSFDKSAMDDLPRFNMQKNMALKKYLTYYLHIGYLIDGDKTGVAWLLSKVWI